MICGVGLLAIFVLLVALSAETRGALSSLVARSDQAEVDVSQITASKTCNGVTYTYTVTQAEGESAEAFRARAAAEIEAWLDTLPC